MLILSPVLDEADRILDMGFQRTLNALLEHLPSSRQTLLFSATQTQSVKDLARLSLHEPVYVGVKEEGSQAATPKSLEQHYVTCDLDKKLDILWSFIKSHLQSKVLVFFSSGKQVRYIQCKLCLNHLYCPTKGPLRLRNVLQASSRNATYASPRKAKASYSSWDLREIHHNEARRDVLHGSSRTRA